MSRTVKAEPRKWYSREYSWARRLTRRLERNRSREHLRHERYDEAGTRQVKNTQGWISH